MQNTFYWTAIPAKLPTVPTLSKSFNVKSLLRLKLWTHCLCCFLSLLLLLFYLSGLPVLWPSVGFPISGRIHADMERKDIAKQTRQGKRSALQFQTWQLGVVRDPASLQAAAHVTSFLAHVCLCPAAFLGKISTLLTPSTSRVFSCSSSFSGTSSRRWSRGTPHTGTTALSWLACLRWGCAYSWGPQGTVLTPVGHLAPFWKHRPLQQQWPPDLSL